MSAILERLLKDGSASDSKSFLIGIERGRIWAQDCADYFELREWSEMDARQFDDLTLPGSENQHFRMLVAETPIEWGAYLRGWLEGVREIRCRY